MKIPKRLYLVGATLLFVAGAATVFALQPSKTHDKQVNFKQTASVAGESTVKAGPIVEPKEPVAPQPTVNNTSALEPEPAPQPPQNPYNDSKGTARWYLFERRIAVGKPLDINYRESLVSTTTPTAHDVAYKGGHIAFVEQVDVSGGLWVSSMNSRGYTSMDVNSPQTGGWGRVSYDYVAPEQVNALYSYLH